MKFIYKFDSIRKIKEIFEKRTQKELASIYLEIKKKEDEYDKVLKLRTSENKKYIKIVLASDLRFHKNYLAVLKDDLEKIRNDIDLLLNIKEAKLLELVQKSKEHKIFDTLEEIHREDFDIEQNRIEMIGMDEIATSRHIRKKATSER